MQEAVVMVRGPGSAINLLLSRLSPRLDADAPHPSVGRWSRWKVTTVLRPSIVMLSEDHQHPAPQIPLVKSWMTPAFTSFSRNSFSLDMLWVQDYRGDRGA
ncbi:hypothetical protein EYF80_012308 [Liparis tanakae]|uniref:Uncharacterized protein n=1 Tax=Liparis tanakae TaxID=230148 RepID=A0A4Z2IJ68_9TELE|nr:hypothetical protein EYF80_012308 [Liparis tanakae]